MHIIKGNSFAEIYHQALDLVYNRPDFESAPRGMKIKECLNVAMELTDPTSNLFRYEDKKLTMPSGYTKREVALYLAASNSASMFAKASPFWDTIKNDDGTINSGYGNLIFNPSLADGRSQFDWAFDSLIADKDSRQAIMRFNNTTHQFTGVKDFPCTFVMIFHIRNNKLYATVEMRSNDIICGLVHDLPSFTLFQYLMFLKLKETKYHDLELGSYTHIDHSLHIYERDFELVSKRLQATALENRFPLPENWRCIKSGDVNVLVDVKINKQDQLFTSWDYPENKAFYDWVLS